MTTRHKQLAVKARAFTRTGNKKMLESLLNAGKKAIIYTLEDGESVIRQIIVSSLPFAKDNEEPETQYAIEDYARFYYDVIFQEMCDGDRATFQHRMKSVIPSALLTLPSAGRPAERIGDYTAISVEVRNDLLTGMDRLPESRREQIENLLIQKFEEDSLEEKALENGRVDQK